ncbi:hypothetical protein [Burkholderia ubonensis]|nr:hypothetical protein [Burkholderia ubonensis]
MKQAFDKGAGCGLLKKYFGELEKIEPIGLRIASHVRIGSVARK